MRPQQADAYTMAPFEGRGGMSINGLGLKAEGLGCFGPGFKKKLSPSI